MPKDVFLGFDFGYKRIGVAVGQRLTCSAAPLSTLAARQGIPNWDEVAKIIHQWQPSALVIGIPTTIDGGDLYTTAPARRFAKNLQKQFNVPVHMVDERFTTTEAKAHLFAAGGYRKIKQTEVDSIAACIILEQWLQHPQ